MPFFGGFISKNRPAYEYLIRSVLEFPDHSELSKIIKEAGFKEIAFYPMTFGLCNIILCEK